MEDKSIIGVDLGGTSISSGLIKNNKVAKLFTQAVSAGDSEQKVLGEVVLAIEEVSNGNVAGIGIGVPSPVDIEKGIVYAVQNIPSWQEVHLKKHLENHFNLPVYVNNDANCFVAGVKYFGAGKNYKNIVGLILGTGVGAGLIIDEKLYCGLSGSAGEVGLLLYLGHTYEYYCSGQFFKIEYGVSGEELYNKAKQGDRKALEIFAIFGEHVGMLIRTILLAYDPEIIVLGGSVSKAFPFFKKSMQERINTFEYKHIVNRFTIKVNMVPEIAVLGAAALYLDAHNAHKRLNIERPASLVEH